jgi:hypothetical protein
MCRIADRRYVVALPPSSWSTLTLRVNVLDEDAGLFSVRGDVEELYVTRMVGEFEVVPWKSLSPQCIQQNYGITALIGIVLRQLGPRVSLGMHLMANKLNVTQDDLLRLATSFALEVSDRAPLAEAVRSLVASFGPASEGVNTFAEMAVQKYSSPAADENALLSDPVVEAVFAEMDIDNKMQFDDINEKDNSFSNDVLEKNIEQLDREILKQKEN